MPNTCACKPNCQKKVANKGWKAVACLRLEVPDWKSLSRSEKDALIQGNSNVSVASDAMYQAEYYQKHREEIARKSPSIAKSTERKSLCTRPSTYSTKVREFIDDGRVIIQAKSLTLNNHHVIDLECDSSDFD